ncbi:MAG TPA: type 1 glutamine amidotransferase [Cyclobacteriaceae bacterium]|nr:type 1 glutamine amidotransferase [Cyclobacteriaceae bacterium]
MNNNILIVKNSTTEGPGLLEVLLRERTTGYSMIDLDSGDKLPPLDNLKAIVVLGGPDSANDENEKMRGELEFIRKVLAAKIPYLGICLGLQTLVKAAGGKVIKSPVKEIGFRDPDNNLFAVDLTDEGRKDPLFGGLGNALKVFHLHGETIEPGEGMTLLASGKFCRNQVVRVGENAYGIQCHFELTEEMFEEWINTDPDLMQFDSEALKKDFKLMEKDYFKTGKRLLRNFLDIAGL